MKNVNFSILLVALLAVTSLFCDVTTARTTYVFNVHSGVQRVESGESPLVTTFDVTSDQQWRFGSADDVTDDGREIVDKAIMTYFGHPDGSTSTFGRTKRDLDEEGVPPFAMGETPIVDMKKWEEEHESLGENPEKQGM